MSDPTPESLAEAIASFLATHPDALVLEDGLPLFDLRTARYSITLAHGRCLLQFWSDERNLVRTVTEFQPRSGLLRLTTRRMGSSKPGSLDLTLQRDRRTASTRESQRRQYQRLLERVLQQHFPHATPDGFRSAADLEHSFGPACTRGQLLFAGSPAHAVIAVGSHESRAAIDGILTVGLLWLHHCRHHTVGRAVRHRHYGALRIIVPHGLAQTTARRMRWLHPDLAAWHLHTLDESTGQLLPVDLDANFELTLPHAFDPALLLDRVQPGVNRILDLLPAHAHAAVELRPQSPTELQLQLHGLPFASLRLAASQHSFQHQLEITFGAGVHTTPLTPENESFCRTLLHALADARHPAGNLRHPLFRLRTEGWIESRIRTALSDLFPSLDPRFVYSQLPAQAASNRDILDLLTIDHSGRLVILEIKATEDLDFPLQGLDYWIRVQSMLAAPSTSGNLFQANGYFPGISLSQLPPRLLLIAPSLRIHPANETILRSLHPQVDWELIALGEDWRTSLRTVFRKRSSDRP